MQAAAGTVVSPVGVKQKTTDSGPANHYPSTAGLSRLSSKSWLWALLLVTFTILAYQPVWHAGFIWDDDVYVIRNKLLSAPDGLRRIWFSQDSPSQYFPLVYTMFRWEYALWGLNPVGYHWINLLLHTVNGLLVWQLLSRLKVPWPWLGAALFTLHPVQVESVAWVTERKNVLSLFFSLLCLLAWRKAVAGSGPGPNERATGGKLTTGPPITDPLTTGPLITDYFSPLWYCLALACYALALFSKTTACTLPAALVLVLWLEHRPLNLRRWLEITPFVLMGLGMGVLTMWWERHHIGTRGAEFAIPLLDRMLIASHGVWFYLAKLLWPFQLAFSYPKWTVDAASPLAYLWLLLGAALVLFIIYARRWVGRGPEVAFAFFVATLSPTLGFIMLFTFRYTFVADHYQYVACLGPLALAAAGLAWWQRQRTDNRNVPASPRGLFVPVFCGALVVTLAGLTWAQARSYRDLETLWRDTVKKNPDSWMARYNLSRDLLHRGKIDEALAEYREAIKSGPDQVNGLVSLGNALFAKGQHDQAADCYRRALQLNPDSPEAHVNLGVILASQGKIDEAIEHDRHAVIVNPMLLNAHVNLAVALASKGLYAEALDHYRQALALNPDQPMTHINLAIALEGLGRTNEALQHYRLAAESVNAHAAGLATQGRLDEAVLQYREAIRLIPGNAEGHCGLGSLLARQGQTEEARRELVEALRLKPGYAEAERALRELDGRR